MGTFIGSGLKGAQASLGMRLLRSSVKEAEVQKHGGISWGLGMFRYILYFDEWEHFFWEVSKICLLNFVWVYVWWMGTIFWEALLAYLLQAPRKNLEKSQQKMPCSSFWVCKNSSWPQIWGKCLCLWIPKWFTPAFLALVGVALRLERAILGFYHITLLHHPPLKKKGGRKGRALPSQLALGSPRLIMKF